MESSARSVSMVAIRRKAEALTKRLMTKEVPADRLARLKSLAGQDLKGVDLHEIVITMLADKVTWRNADRVSREIGDDDSG